MRNSKFVDEGGAYRPPLHAVLKASNTLIEAGERDASVILAQVRSVAESDPLALDFWNDADGLADDIRAKISDLRAKEIYARRTAELQAEKKARQAASSNETPGDDPTPTVPAPESATAPVAPEPEHLDLLPFPPMPLKSGGEPVPIPGYLIDRWCRPHGTGPRRKAGPLIHLHYWDEGKDGRRFKSGYRLTVGDKRPLKPDWWFGLARNKAEQVRREAG
jgi:hypothetical protein